MISAVSKSFSKITRSASSLRLSAIDSLPLLTETKYADFPFTKGPYSRASSPVPGVSTFITRAPRSDKIIVENGPARTRVRSITVTPLKGPGTGMELTPLGV